jgi:hypothetical protein
LPSHGFRRTDHVVAAENDTYTETVRKL